MHNLNFHTGEMTLADDGDLAKIAAETKRFTEADLENVVRRTGVAAIRGHGEAVQVAGAADFAKVLADSRATVNAEVEEEYLKIGVSLRIAQ